jgi:hypothetical protein
VRTDRGILALALCLLALDAGSASALREAPGRRLGVLTDVEFQPTEAPSLEGVPVEQVVVTSDALAGSFQAFADHETFRGVPTVVRTTSWIDSEYAGPDRAARIRSFLRDAHEQWGTVYAVLGGDVEHVPVRYVAWDGQIVPTDLYYECLDREWNEDGDALYAEPLATGGLESWVSDVDWAPDGTLWLGTNVGACALELGQFTQWRVADGLPSDLVHALDAAADGSVWICAPDAVARWDGAAWTTWSAADGVPGSQVTTVLAAGGDDAWVGTNGGLGHWDGTDWTVWTTADGLPDDVITALAIDGVALWIGTAHGVARFTGGAFTLFDEASGLLSDWVLSISVESPGVVWFGHDDNFFAQGGFSRFAGGAFTTDDLPAWGGLAIRDLHAGPGGELWAATPSGLFHRDAGGDELLGAADGLAGSDFSGVARAGSIAVAGAEGLTVGAPASWTVWNAASGLPAPVLTWDDVDLVPDVAVGRIPATDAAEVGVYLAKLLDYRQGIDASRADEALFLGEILFEGEDGKDYCEAARAEFPPSFGTTGLYESDGTQNVASTLAALNQGPGYVVHVAHGSYDVMGAGPELELLFHGDLDAIASAGRLAFYVVYSCHSGGFDQECSTERLLFNPNGGAIATMANTRSAVAGVDADFNLTFWSRFFASSHGQAVLAMHEARDERYAGDPAAYEFQTWWRRTYVSRSYLGAPTLSLWRSVPAPLAVAHPAALPAGRSDVTVTVTDPGSGAPLADALVCLSKGTEDYAYGRTGATGAVTFDFRPESAGVVVVRVSAPERLPYEGTAVVAAPTGPLPVAAGWQPGGTSAARATGMNFTLALRNAGTASASGWSVQLSSGEPFATVVQGAGTLPALDSGETGWTTSFSLAIDPALPDGAPVRLVLTGTGPTSFTEEWTVAARTAGIRLVRLLLVGGAIFPEIENAGAVGTGPVTAALAAHSGGGTVLDGTASIADVPPGASYFMTDPFVVTGPSSAVFELTVSDTAGHAFAQLVDREAPEGVTELRATPRDGGSTLEWSPSGAPDLAGTGVWGRSAGGGAWQEELGGAIVPSASVEVDFDGAREFLVLAVDESGNASTDSAFVVAHAAAPSLAGWPVRLGSVLGPAPVAVADLDLDGSPEVVFGSMWESNAIHVFRANGVEWTDGDGDPSTPGIFGQAQDRVLSPPLVVDVDGDGSKEIFAGSYDGSLYAWRTDGPAGPPAALPGWPIYQAFNGVRSAPAAADLDGDSDLEIVAVVNQGDVSAFHVDGTVVAGWPFPTPHAGLGSSPVIHDFDLDGRDDVVFGATDSSLYVVRGDGTELPGWPVRVGAKIQSSPVLVDADGDGDFEIFVIDRNGSVWAFQHDDGDAVPGPDPLPGWPVATIPADGSPPSPAVADFDGDDVPELVVAGDGEIAVLRMDGTAFPGTPIVAGAMSTNSPVVADLDGDRSLDVLVGSADYRLTAWAIDGTVLPGWPRALTEEPNSTPYVADVDGDGDLDVAMGADDAFARVIGTPGPAIPGAAPWPGYQGVHDARGRYVHVRLGSAAPDPLAPAPAGVVLLSAAPNPFRGGTTVRFALPAGAWIRVDVHDVAGRRVATPAAGFWPPGAHAVPWDGTDRSGRPVASGMYFLRLSAGDASRTAKVLRLR